MTSGFLPRAVVRKGPPACLAPPNRGGLNSIHIHGTSVPVEEPSTASEAAICIAAKEARGCSVLFDHFVGAHLPSPTGAANLPSATNYKVTVWRNSSLSGRPRPSATGPLLRFGDPSCFSFWARPALYGVCASLTSLLARGFRPRRPSPRSARPVTLRLPMSPPPWPRRHASALAKRAMLPSWSRTHRLSRSQTQLSTRWSAISG